MAQADALRRNDIEHFLTLVRQSGDSSYKFLQNCSCVQDVHHQPIPVAIAMSEFFLNGKGACRVHGGGFAGTILAFVPLGMFTEYKRFMENSFGTGSVIPLHIRQPGYEYFQIDSCQTG